MTVKILVSASAGGHCYEALRLESVFKKNETILITEKNGIGKNKIFKKIKLIPYDDGNSLVKSLVIASIAFFLTVSLILKHRFVLHISFGSHVSIGCTIACWIFRVKTIHIESFTRVNGLSKSGKLIKFFADDFYVQWASLTQTTKANFVGSLF